MYFIFDITKISTNINIFIVLHDNVNVNTVEWIL